MISGEAPIAISFDGSNLDESADPELAPLGTLTTLLNYEKDRMGVLRRRGGFRATSITGWSQSRTSRLTEASGALGNADGNSIWRFDQVAGTWEPLWHAPDLYLYAAKDAGAGDASGLRDPTVAMSGDFVVVAWAVSFGATDLLHYAVLDATTLQVIVPARQHASGVSPNQWKLIASGDEFVIAYQASAQITMHRMHADLFSVQSGFTSFIALATDADTTTPLLDLCATGTTANPHALLVYHRNQTGTHRVSTIIVDVDGGTSVHASVVNIATLTPVALNCDGRPDHTYVMIAAAGATSANVGAALVNQSNGIQVAYGTVMTVSGGNVQTIGVKDMGYSTDPNTWAIVAGYTDQLSTGEGAEGEIAWQLYERNGAALDSQLFAVHRTRGCTPATSPFTDGLDVYCWVKSGGSFDDTNRRPYAAYSLLRLTRDGATYVGSYNSGQGGYETDFMLQVGTGGFSYELGPTAKPGVASSPDETRHIAALRVDHEVRLFDVRSTNGAVGVLVPERVGQVAILTGGAQPMLWDGNTLSELGFSDAPAVLLSLAGASGVPAGTYQYAVTAEFYDAAGNRYQSSPWFSDAFVIGVDNDVLAEIDTLPLTNKIRFGENRLALQFVLWRTTAGPGSIFFRHSARPVITGASSPVDRVDILDQKDDTELLEQSTETLYAHPGGALPNQMPPPTRHLSTFGSRVAGIDAEHEGRIWFSKQLTPGEGIAHSSILEQYVHGIGELRALLEMDGSLYALGDDGIALAAYGDGPNDAGQGSWPQAQTIARGVSCFGGHCVAVIPDGAVFAGTADNSVRIWLLPRGGGQPVVISNPVKQSLDGATTIKRVMAVTDRSKVFVAYSDTGLLVYDYANKRPDGLGSWSRWTPGTIGALEDLLDVDGTLWVGDGDQPDVASLTEDLFDTSRTSVQTAINTLLGTANIRPARPFAAGKVNAIAVAAEYQGDATLAVQHIGAETKVGTFAFSSLTAGSVYNRYWQPDVVRDITGQGFRLLFACSATTGGVIPRFAEVDYVTEQGGFRPADAERA